MCEHCQQQTTQQAEEREPSREQQEERVDRHAAAHYANLRTIPGGNSLGAFLADSLDAHSDLRVQLGGLWWHTNVQRPAESLGGIDIERLWDAAFLRKDGTSVSLDAVRLTPNCVHRVWRSKMVTDDDAGEPYKWAEGAWTDVGRYPAPSLSLRAGQKLTRPLLAAVRSWQWTTAETVEVWERFAEKLGTAWGRDSETWGISVSCAPSAFLRLGHYGEYCSCYRAGGQYGQAPWALSMLPRSVVVLFYRGAYDTPAVGPRQAEPAGRAWGALSTQDHPGLCASNLYKLSWDTVRPMLRSVVADLFSLDRDTVESRECSSYQALAAGLDCDTIYFNGDGQTFAPDTTDAECELRRYFHHRAEEWAQVTERCPCCGGYVDEYDSVYCEDCGQQVCGECGWYDDVDGAYYCVDCRSPRSCSECGNTTSSDNLLECTSCGCDICADCVRYCSDCGDPICEGCTTECQECGDSLCESCALSCADCGNAVCSSCSEECEGCGERVCESCQDEHRESVCEQLSVEAM